MHSRTFVSIKQRLLVGVTWMFAGNWSEQIINFLVFILLARILGAEVFGLATMAMVFVVFSEFLVRQTLTETIVQQKNLEDGHLDAIFYLLALLSVVLVALLILLAEQIAQIYSEPRVADYLTWASPTVLFIGLSGVPVALLKRKLEFRVLAVRATVGIVTGGIVGVILAFMDYGVWCFIVQHVVKVFVNNALVWTANPWTPKWRAKKKHFHDVLSFSGQIVGLRITELISINTPMVVIGAYLGPGMLGQFTIAWRIVEVLSFLLITPIQYVAQPAFAHLDRASEAAGDLLAKITKISALVSFPSFLGMVVVSAPLVELLFGDEWVGAITAHKILCFVGIYLSIERIQQAYCLALGKVSALFYLSFAEALLGILLIITFVDYGIMGVAIAFAARYYIMWPFRFIIVSNYADRSLLQYLKVLVLPLINAIIMTFITVAWQQLMGANFSTFTLLASSVLVGLSTYCVVLWATMRTQVRELFKSLILLREKSNSF
ncbi:Membrane protein involved in the export of O-antigen and teichoic acid [Cycloclasticus pugetii]|nr:Membrane protein involved in the export of O-antigen and teichoic acid [Cycloclasticus pugetii]